LKRHFAASNQAAPKAEESIAMKHSKSESDHEETVKVGSIGKRGRAGNPKVKSKNCDGEANWV